MPVMILGPMISYPFSKTTWVAIDRAFLQRLDRGGPTEERIHRI